MMTRIVLLVLALISSAHANAALWQIEFVNSGNILATFKHNPGGPIPYFEDIRIFGYASPIFETYFAFPPYTDSYVPNDDSHMSAAHSLYFRFVADFAAPLTAAGGNIGVDYAGWSGDGTWCRGDVGCYEWSPGALVARSMADDVPVPATFLLIMAALPTLALRRGAKRRHV